MQPPKKALAFLRWFCREDYLEEIVKGTLDRGVSIGNYKHNPEGGERIIEKLRG